MNRFRSGFAKYNVVADGPGQVFSSTIANPFSHHDPALEANGSVLSKPIYLFEWKIGLRPVHKHLKGEINLSWP